MMQWGAERFLYGPMIMGILVCTSLQKTFSSATPNPWLKNLGFLWLLSIAVLSWQRQNIWQNDHSLGHAMLKSNPASYHGLKLVLTHNRLTENFTETLALGQRFLPTNPKEEFIYHHLIYAHLALKQDDAARKLIQRAKAENVRTPLLQKMESFLSTK